MPPGPSHPLEPPCSPHGNKRKKGRKLRSRAEGGRLACGGATNEQRRTGGHPRGKQFLLIQRSHPHGGAKAWWTRSWTSLLLDLPPSSPRQPVPFTNECSRSPSLALHLFLRPSRLLPPRSSPLPQPLFILALSFSSFVSFSLSLSSPSSSSVSNRSVYDLAIGAMYPPCVSKNLGRPESMFIRD